MSIQIPEVPAPQQTLFSSERPIPDLICMRLPSDLVLNGDGIDHRQPLAPSSKNMRLGKRCL